MKGHLITFEGIDFSGKSVQATLLADALRKHALSVTLLREPGGTEISEKIRALLLDVANADMGDVTELLLYSAARAQIVSECVIPHLEQGDVVVCDRYYDSTTAYQGYGRELDLTFVAQLNAFATKSVTPDVTFLIDLSPDAALKRKQSQRGELDRLEQEHLLFHKRVRAGYLEIARAEPQRFHVIDGEQAIDEIQSEVLTVVRSRLNLF